MVELRPFRRRARAGAGFENARGRTASAVNEMKESIMILTRERELVRVCGSFVISVREQDLVYVYEGPNWTKVYHLYPTTISHR